MRSVCVAALVALAIGCGQNDSESAERSDGYTGVGPGDSEVEATAVGQAPERGGEAAAGGDYDRRFLDTMTAHHRMGIDMMQMAVQQASHDEVKRLAERMAAAQRRDVEEMGAMRGRLGGDSAAAPDMSLPGTGSMQMDMQHMHGLSGAQFDRMWVDMTISHHEGAVAMARDAAANASSEEVGRKAQAMVEMQTRELEELRTLQAKLG